MSLHIAPSEFWGMDPAHFWWLVETIDPPKQKGPNLTRAEGDELLNMLREAKRKEKTGGGTGR